MLPGKHCKVQSTCRVNEVFRIFFLIETLLILFAIKPGRKLQSFYLFQC